MFTDPRAAAGAAGGVITSRIRLGRSARFVALKMNGPVEF
jgi:hypothetical protein